MAASDSEQFVLLNSLADEFAERYRHGERPLLSEYIDRHPQLADDIREFFPAMVEMEQVKEARLKMSEPTATGPLPPLERLGDFRIIREIGHLAVLENVDATMRRLIFFPSADSISRQFVARLRRMSESSGLMIDNQPRSFTLWAVLLSPVFPQPESPNAMALHLVSHEDSARSQIGSSIQAPRLPGPAAIDRP